LRREREGCCQPAGAVPISKVLFSEAGNRRTELRPEAKQSSNWCLLRLVEGSIDDIIVNVWNRTQWARINER
jgi:ElaB/YqjD/DUF883 family membrane-anchored ribosome-binding protein